ncbi:hypothetical protein J6590_016587 [Homalodisca vitripennis]|nr:hypothetical protein J6590_016587 [Homalodisca vitripennis]
MTRTLKKKKQNNPITLVRDGRKGRRKVGMFRPPVAMDGEKSELSGSGRSQCAP